MNTQSQSSVREHKIVVVGNDEAGKFSLTYRFTYDRFVNQRDPFEDSFRKRCLVDKEISLVDVEILKTASNESYSVTDECIRSGQGYLFVYSIANRSSFERIPEFHQQILRVKHQVVPMVLVGTKSDLEHHREVSTDEARDLAKQFGCPFLETCSKIGINVDESFCELVREIRKPKPQEQLREQARKRKSVDDKATPNCLSHCVIL
ncbi:ras-like protein 1 [Cyathus striatus]|nr:ras-like protein 1 [Cyathus striatus]